MKPRKCSLVLPAEIQRLSKSNVTFSPLFFPTDNPGYTIWYHIVISRCTQPPTRINVRIHTRNGAILLLWCVRWILTGGGAGQ